MKSLEELKVIKEQAKQNLVLRERNVEYKVTVSMGECGYNAGAREILTTFLEEVANRSKQETFTRTIYTSLTTLIPVLALIFLGSKEILTFNLAMLFGLIAGTYSSIFIAVAIYVAVEKKSLGKTKKKKKIYTDEIQEKKIKGINC